MVAREYDFTINAGEQCSPLLNACYYIKANFKFVVFRQTEGTWLSLSCYILVIKEKKDDT